MNNIVISSATDSFPAKAMERVLKSSEKKLPVKSEQPAVKSSKVEKNIQLDEQIKKINEKLSGEDRKILYSVHEGTNTLIFKIVDKNTGEIIKEVPSTKLLDISAEVIERFGLIVDKKV